jgi:hypothetical protein
MRTTPIVHVPEPDRLGLPGEVLTRRAVTAVTATIVAMTFAFSLGNVTRLCLGLGITAWIAWLVAPAVDLSVIGLLTGMRFLSLHGYADAQLAGLQRMLRFCGLLTLALNIAGALGHRQYGTALVDAVGPALLIGWSEAGPWLLRQIHAVCPPVTRPEPVARQRPQLASAQATQVLPAGLLARARVLDAAHRAETGRPISLDKLRSAEDRPGPGQRPGRRRSRRGNRQSRTPRGKPGSITSDPGQGFSCTHRSGLFLEYITVILVSPCARHKVTSQDSREEKGSGAFGGESPARQQHSCPALRPTPR